MVAGLDIKGLDSIGGFGFSNIPSGATQIIMALAVFIFAAAFVYAIYVIFKSGKDYKKTIHWFEVIGNKPQPNGEDKVKEIIVPGSNLPIFKLKGKSFFLPRGTIQTGKDHYWYFIRNNREIVNFTLGDLNKQMKDMQLDFDHTDMRYALANLRAIIDRNYKDKSMPWWKLYKDQITIVIYIFVLTLSFWFIAAKLGQVVQTVNTGLQILSNSCPALSGVAPG